MVDKLAALLGDQATQTPSSSAAGAGGDGVSDAEKVQADNVRLRQRLATLEKQQQDALPFVETMVELLKTPEGQEVVKKVRAGEPLTKKEERTVVATNAEDQPVTMKDLKEILLEHGKGVVSAVAETTRNTQTAAERHRALEQRAEKELPGLKKLKGTPVWNGNMSAVIGAIQNGTLEVKEGEDPFWVAHERTYHMCVAADPDIAKGKQPSAVSETDRLKELLATRKQPAASTVSDEEAKMLEGATEQQLRDLALARNLGKGTGALARI
jgi:hypothetical protein